MRDGAVLARLGPGELLGEMAMLNDPHRNADVYVTEDVELAVWDRSAFLGALAHVPPFDQLVRRTAMLRAA